VDPSAYIEIPLDDAVYCLGRALVLAILVSSEALLARQRRVGFERHLILFSTFICLLAAEIMGLMLGLGASHGTALVRPEMWIWYPLLSTVGLLGVAFCFDFVRISRSYPAGPLANRLERRHSRVFLIAAGVIFSLGALLSAMTDTLSVGAPTSYEQMGRASLVLHGLQAVAYLLLAWKAFQSRIIWLSATETRVFLWACVSGLLGAMVQMVTGPCEFLTTLAFTLFVAVFLRDNYRRSEIQAVRAIEKRTERTLLLHRITTQLKSTSDLSHLYELLMDSLMGNLGAESGAIYLAAPHTHELRPVLVRGQFPPPMPPEKDDESQGRLAAMPRGLGVLGPVAENGTPLYIDNPKSAERLYTWPTPMIRSTIALPLRSPEGVYGAVQLVNRKDGAAFSEEDLRLMSLVVEQAGLAIYNARLQNEVIQRQRSEEQMKIARQIQLRLIPTDLPRIPGLSLGVQYTAAQEVGGDYFDFYRIDHDHLGVLVFDVAGKGVPGALLMAITGTFLKMASPRSTSPAWVLNEVNAALSADMRRGLYVTAMYGVLTLSTLQFSLVCAGHPDAFVIRERGLVIERYKPRGAAIGLLRPNRFRAVMEQETMQLEQGDTVLFYTDGVTEAMNEQGEPFGEERLLELCKRFARQGPKKLSAEITESIRQFAGAAPQYDDITVVALRIWPEEEPPATPPATV